MNYENYLEYAKELEGGIILSVDVMKVRDINEISSYFKKKKHESAVPNCYKKQASL